MRSARQVVAELASSPRFWSASCARLRSRSVCRECDVRADEAAPCGVNKRRAHDDMDVVERLGRKLTPGPAATGEEVVVETVDVFDAKAAQVNVADARSEGSPPQPDQPGRTAIALGRPLIHDRNVCVLRRPSERAVRVPRATPRRPVFRPLINRSGLNARVIVGGAISIGDSIGPPARRTRSIPTCAPRTTTSVWKPHAKCSDLTLATCP